MLCIDFRTEGSKLPLCLLTSNLYSSCPVHRAASPSNSILEKNTLCLWKWDCGTAVGEYSYLASTPYTILVETRRKYTHDDTILVDPSLSGRILKQAKARKEVRPADSAQSAVPWPWAHGHTVDIAAPVPA